MAQHSKQNLPQQLSKQQQLKKALLPQLLEQSQQWAQEVTTTPCELLLPAYKLTHIYGTNTIQPGFAALGAVAVAAVGVWGVFKMAMAVAEGTGRTLNSNVGAAPAAASASAPYSPEASGLLPMQPAVPSGPGYPPSPQHRKVWCFTQ